MYCAIDFGTSNSAVAIPGDDGQTRGQTRLIELEPGHHTMPTAVFYFVEGSEHDGPPRAFGRAAVAAYVDGLDGRLLRSMKSILGSSLVEQTTDVGGGRGATYLDIVAGYLRHLKRTAEAAVGTRITRAVLGRPVFFVDDDPARDASAQDALETAARRVGLDEIHFQFEPIAAAFDHERRIAHEEIVLVADIGGGTSDFSLVRVGPDRMTRVDRRSDILANHGVHIAGTDFDRRIELDAVLPLFGFRAYGPLQPGVGEAREVPSGVYHDLATWHLINTVYSPARVAELRQMRRFYADARQHDRLMTVVSERLGHELLARTEVAKIDISQGGLAHVDLSLVERDLAAALDESHALSAIEHDLERIVAAARETARAAGLPLDKVDAVYFTGGSTGLRQLSQAIAAAFPAARAVYGDRFASVACGLGLHAQRLFGEA